MPGLAISPSIATERAFFGACVLVFVATAAGTIAWCASMSAMHEMPMPGGWTMSMTWMRMPDQTWLEAGATFVAMWIAMMAAMMLPAFVPMLSRYRAALVGQQHLGWLTALVSMGYLAVWAMLGAVIFPVGAALAAIEMQFAALARAVPVVAGVVIVLAGALQLTAWKARQLVCCQESPRRDQRFPANTATAWRYGLRLGVHCSLCCSGPVAVLLVVGVMDWRAMAVVTAAITAERLRPRGVRIAQASGLIAVCTGLLWIAQAVGFFSGAL